MRQATAELMMCTPETQFEQLDTCQWLPATMPGVRTMHDSVKTLNRPLLRFKILITRCFGETIR